MCGITGVVNYDTQPSKQILTKALLKIAHRGPDSRGLYFDKHVALGIMRLSIIDLKTGDQPISSEDASVTVVFNGEIYNFIKLRKDLIDEGHVFKTNTDTECLVHLYEKYGVRMMGYLNGMFAFAIWDKKNKRLFIGRDHAGIKPLFYWSRGNKLIFGSEIKTILEYPEVKKDVNQNALAIYSHLGFFPGANSIFKQINKLEPGNYLEFSEKGLKIKKYYEFNSMQYETNLSLDELFEDVIKKQSIADVPLGVFLSGGLDSSLVTYYLSRLNHNVKTFSISFNENSFDESSQAKLVAKYLKVPNYQEKFTDDDVKKNFDRICSKLDEPLADPSLFPTFKVSKLARRYVKVVLSGDGGDELFGGYPTYQGHLIAGKFSKILSFLSPFVVNSLKYFPVSFNNYPKAQTLMSFFLGLQKNLVDRHIFWMSLFPSGQNNLVNINTNSWYQNRKRSTRSENDIILKMQKFDFLSYLTDDLLVKVDRASMFNSLEVRVPFLDPRIIKSAFSGFLNHVDLFSTKKEIRHLLKGKLPEHILNRKKKGFGIPLGAWLCAGLKDLAYDNLKNPKLDNYFSRKKIDNIWLDHQNKKVNNAKAIWMLVMFSGWMQKWGKE